MPRVTITVPDKNAQPYRFQLEREVVTLGRGEDNDIVIDSGSVSTTHAEMRRNKGGYELVDVGSTNGLKWEGERYNIVPLLDGVSAQIGDVTFDFSLSAEEQEALASEANPVSAPGRTFTPAPPMPGHEVIRPAAGRKVVIEREAPKSGALMAVGLLFLALVAFGLGASIRHQKETGGSLIDDVKANFSKDKNETKLAPEKTEETPVEVTPAVPVPVPVEAPPATPAPAVPVPAEVPPPAEN